MDAGDDKDGVQIVSEFFDMGYMGTSGATDSTEVDNEGGATNDDGGTFVAAMEEFEVTETMMTLEADHWRLKDDIVYDLVI